MTNLCVCRCLARCNREGRPNVQQVSERAYEGPLFSAAETRASQHQFYQRSERVSLCALLSCYRNLAHFRCCWSQGRHFRLRGAIPESGRGGFVNRDGGRGTYASSCIAGKAFALAVDSTGGYGSSEILLTPAHHSLGRKRTGARPRMLPGQCASKTTSKCLSYTEAFVHSCYTPVAVCFLI